MISGEWLAERLAELPTHKQMYRAVLLGVATGACLVQCLARLFHALASMQIFWSLTAIASLFAIVFLLTRPQSD